MNSMICPKCGNLISYNSYFGAYYCSVCGEYFQEIKKTNADKIRGMSNEELAEFIKNIKVRAALCKAVKNNDAFEELCSAEWLQQPAEEDDND